MGRGYMLVEGHGEVRAMVNLITRLWAHLDLPFLSWADPMRSNRLHLRREVEKLCGYVRSRGDAECLLLLRDEDDLCPAEVAPAQARWLEAMALPFASALVLLHREYETLFLPCVHLMAGRELISDRGIRRPGLLPETRWQGDYERTRGVKEWLSRNFPSGTSYKPTLDQLPMTRLLDLQVLHDSELPSFMTLERALRFLSTGRGASAVYPRRIDDHAG